MLLKLAELKSRAVAVELSHAQLKLKYNINFRFNANCKLIIEAKFSFMYNVHSKTLEITVNYWKIDFLQLGIFL